MGPLYINFNGEILEADSKLLTVGNRGFKFRGSTICYAFMQAVGMVDDHMDHCWKKTKKR